MGDVGPVPARSEERRRRNAPAHPIWKLGPEELKALPFEIDLSPVAPELPAKSTDQRWKDEHPDRRWGKQVTEFYEAIKRDPMVAWMTAGDWAMVMIVLEDLDRELKPQVVGVTPAVYSTELQEVIGGEAITAVVPMKGAKLAALNNVFKSLGMGEGNRLRMQKEVTLFGEYISQLEGEGDNGEIAATRLELLQGGQA